MKSFFPLFVAIFALFISACQKTDFSKPEEVISEYRSLTNTKEYEVVYDEFLSTKSKEFVTKDEFISNQQNNDTTTKITKHLTTKIQPLEVKDNNPTYRRFKVDETKMEGSDTLVIRYYYTLINENGNWKVIWTNTLFNSASGKFDKGNYTDARNSVEKIIEIDPFNGSTYSLLAWCYMRDRSLKRQDWEKGVLENAKYALALEEDYPRHYNTLASYYSSIGNNDLAIMKYEQGLSFCLNKKDKTTFYSNISSIYITQNMFQKAEEYIRKTIQIDSSDTFAWFQYAIMMKRQYKNKDALTYFEKAIKLKKMDNALQAELYYEYAGSCFENKNYTVAKEFISKALDIAPDDEGYKYLYRQIKAFSN